MKKAALVLWCVGLLAACNNSAAPENTDQDQTRQLDSGATPGANTNINDTLTMPSGAGVDSNGLDTLNRNNTR